MRRRKKSGAKFVQWPAFRPANFSVVVVTVENCRRPSSAAPKSKTPRRGRGVFLYERKYTTKQNIVKGNFKKSENIFKSRRVNQLRAVENCARRCPKMLQSAAGGALCTVFATLFCW